MEYVIHWFRRDLRLAGNHLLRQMIAENEGRVLGVFCFDRHFLARDDFSVNRFQFFLETLSKLKEEMQSFGGDLLVIDEPPQIAFKKLFEDLQKNKIALPKMMSWNRDYEPFARVRDEEIERMLNGFEIFNLTARDHLLIEPWELLKNDGKPYLVFTPFSKKWIELFESDEVQKRIAKEISSIQYLEKKSAKRENVFKLKWKDLFKNHFSYPDSLEKYREINKKKITIPIPEAGSFEAFHCLKKFSEKIADYGIDRDIPSIKGTSGLSIFLKNGSLTIPQVIHFLNLKGYWQKKTGKEIFLSELIWREFYYHILYHFPNVEKEAFNEKYQDLAWENSIELFEKWKKGETGFPIVDAAMRQLNQTGWMHNRLRMIVGSFLTKDLLIDWRWGEQYFMHQLLDGDMAANNGGWQWVASTGVDASPYFRVFNPWLQGKKFDSEGEFIKKYIPELKNLEAKYLHSPNPTLSSQYIKPIVDHDAQRFKVLKMFKKL